MIFHIILDASDDGGFTAHVPAMPGCISEGNTREEAVANIQEAIKLYLEAVDGDLISPTGEVVKIAL